MTRSSTTTSSSSSSATCAAVLQGHPETTVDLDILPRHAPVNAEHLADALRSLDAVHVSSGDERATLGVDDRDFVGWREVCSFDTAAGRIDVIPVAAGIGTFDDTRDTAVAIDLDGFEVLAASLDAVIASKRGHGTAQRPPPAEPAGISRPAPDSDRERARVAIGPTMSGVSYDRDGNRAQLRQDGTTWRLRRYSARARSPSDHRPTGQ